jgi:hypothetical protein
MTSEVSYPVILQSMVDESPFTLAIFAAISSAIFFF